MGAPAGFFSTFGALTSSIEGGTRLSDADAAAWAAEFTEPDQRAGMLGTDVASMALIVERLAEYTTSGLSDTRLKHAFPALDLDTRGAAPTPVPLPFPPATRGRRRKWQPPSPRSWRAATLAPLRALSAHRR